MARYSFNGGVKGCLVAYPHFLFSFAASTTYFSLGLPGRRFGTKQSAALLRRSSPVTGFKTLDKLRKVEQEELSSYEAARYYPVFIGEVLNSRYHVVVKLGFGANSTVWLCRDHRQASGM